MLIPLCSAFPQAGVVADDARSQQRQEAASGECLSPAAAGGARAPLRRSGSLLAAWGVGSAKAEAATETK
eukprot:356139-Chlamydomonas_euryale.AAC.8